MKKTIISLETLQLFCEPKGTLRDYISVPALIENRVLATDGHLIIIAPKSECETTVFDRKGLSNFPNISEIESRDYSQKLRITIPDYDTQDCEQCDGHGMFIDVESLCSSAYFKITKNSTAWNDKEVTSECICCDGTGVSFEKPITQIDGDVDLIDSRLLHKVRKVLGKNVVIGISKKPNQNLPIKITSENKRIKTIIYLMGLRDYKSDDANTVYISPITTNNK